MRKKNKGFSLVELVIVIAIIAILTAILTPAIIGKVEEANKSKALQEAMAIYDTAKNVLMNAKADESSSFSYAIKFASDTNGDGDVTTADDENQRCGRFTNQSLAKYINAVKAATTASNPNPTRDQIKANFSSSALSKDTDFYIAENLASSVPGAMDSTGALGTNSPIDKQKSTKYMSEHPEEWGKVVFAMAYRETGQIIYFNCVYEGYFIQVNEAGDVTVEPVSEKKFNAWPMSGDRLPYASGW